LNFGISSIGTRCRSILIVSTSSDPPPFPQIDIIGAKMILWRVRGKIIRSVLCTIVRNNCAQYSAMHTHTNGPNSSLEWVLSHRAHFTVLRFIFTARRSYASAVLGVVILSVLDCPCVRLSHACFVTNPNNLPAIFLYHMKGQSF